MATVIFKLKEPNGTDSTLIYLIFNYGFSVLDAQGNRVYKFLKVSTGEKVDPKYWKDKPDYRVKETKAYPGYAELNTRLNTLENSMLTVYRRTINDGEPNPTPELLKGEFEIEIGRKQKEKKMGVVSYIEKQIKEVKALRRENTIKKYQTTLSHLKTYSESRGRWLDFQDINMRFYSDFHKFLVIEKGFSDNTFGKYIATLKGFMNMAHENRITDARDYKHSKFRVLIEDVDKIYLTLDELKKIYKVNLKKNPRLERVRDMFIVECFLGLRFSDLNSLTPENIYKTDKGEFIKLTTRKTDEVVVCPIHPIVDEILDKYDGQLPPSISNQKTNDYLKEIGEKAKINEEVKVTKTVGGKLTTTTHKKFELITTHTARRSFASNAYLAGIPAISIMKITGHRTEQSFLRYIRISPEENAMKLLEHPFFTS